MFLGRTNHRQSLFLPSKSRGQTPDWQAPWIFISFLTTLPYYKRKNLLSVPRKTAFLFLEGSSLKHLSCYPGSFSYWLSLLSAGAEGCQYYHYLHPGHVLVTNHMYTEVMSGALALLSVAAFALLFFTVPRFTLQAADPGLSHHLSHHAHRQYPFQHLGHRVKKASASVSSKVITLSC